MSANDKLAATFSGPCDGSCCPTPQGGCLHRESCDYHKARAAAMHQAKRAAWA